MHPSLQLRLVYASFLFEPVWGLGVMGLKIGQEVPEELAPRGLRVYLVFKITTNPMGRNARHGSPMSPAGLKV